MSDDYDDDTWEGDPVVVPITDTLDLHHFKPSEVPDLIDEYIHACRKEGILNVRIIHGKGKGILKERVRSILARHPQVHSFSDANMGNWGATSAVLSP